MPAFWTVEDDALVIPLRVTPRASRSRIDGVVALADGSRALAVRVASAPVDGEANAAVTSLLAQALKLRERDLAIVSGDRGRLKRVRAAGDPMDIVARLQDVLGLKT